MNLPLEPLPSVKCPENLTQVASLSDGQTTSTGFFKYGFFQYEGQVSLPTEKANFHCLYPILLVTIQT